MKQLDSRKDRPSAALEAKLDLRAKYLPYTRGLWTVLDERAAPVECMLDEKVVDRSSELVVRVGDSTIPVIMSRWE